MKCKDCKWSKSDGVLHCHYNLPVPTICIGDESGKKCTVGVFPIVREDDFCKEFVKSLES